MIADLIDDKLHLRLITRNILSVYSTNNEYTDYIIQKLKHSEYKVNSNLNKQSLISYSTHNYNIYENIYRYVKNDSKINYNKFIEYLNYFDLCYLLWLHFYQLDHKQQLMIETLFNLSSNARIIILDYLDELSEYKLKLYSLIFNVGLEDKIIIIPHTNITDAVNNSTCQCYIKNKQAVKIQSTFSNAFLNKEFNTSVEYYKNCRPKIYKKEINYIVPNSYKYTLYELFCIFIYRIKMIYTSFYLWRTSTNVN